MKRLDVQSCLSLYRDMTLSEILKDVSRSRIGLICDSSAFWAAVVERFYGRDFFAFRGDIDERDFKLLAQSLNMGRSLFYSVLINKNAPETKVTNPIAIRSLDEGALLRQNEVDDDVINFELLGLEPIPSSKGYVAEHIIWNTDDNYFHTVCLLGKETDDLRDIAARFRSHINWKVMSDLKRIAIEGDIIVFNISGQEITRWIFGVDDVNLTPMIAFNNDPSLLTELWIGIDDDRDIAIQMWVAQIEF